MYVVKFGSKKLQTGSALHCAFTSVFTAHVGGCCPGQLALERSTRAEKSVRHVRPTTPCAVC
jgi:hypothetical protein